jgi:hypothetical protein
MAIISDFLIGNRGKKDISIDTFRSKFIGNNARAYLFLCAIQFPGIQNDLKSGVLGALANGSIVNGLTSAAETAIGNFGIATNTDDFKYFVKSTTLPESILEETSTYWAGQQYKMSGVRKTNDWTVTFLVNEDASIIRKFWDWHLLMHNPETNMYGNPIDYMTDQSIQLLGTDGGIICNYKLFGTWPKQIGAVSLDYSINEFASIEVTFTYQYHTITQNGEPGLLEAARKAIISNGI